MSRCVFCGNPRTVHETFIGGRLCAGCISIIDFRPVQVAKVMACCGSKVRELVPPLIRFGVSFAPGVYVASRVVTERWTGPRGEACALWSVFEGIGRTPEEATHVLSQRVKDVLTGGEP